jgi:hypothetical protein
VLSGTARPRPPGVLVCRPDFPQQCQVHLRAAVDGAGRIPQPSRPRLRPPRGLHAAARVPATVRGGR